jgi:phosphoenolpyruvate carboxykinase (ATP)
MPIGYTRAMLSAALDGRLDRIACARDAIFNLDVPTACPDVPADLLTPRAVWPSEDAYVRQARTLAGMFAENFNAFAAGVDPEVRAAGPVA